MKRLILICLVFLIALGKHCNGKTPLINIFDENYDAADGQSIIMPDISAVTDKIKKGDFFFDMNPIHRKAIRELKNVFQRMATRADLIQLIRQLRNHPELNPHVWLRGAIRAILKRPDAANFYMPPLITVEPGRVLPAEAIQEVLDQSKLPEDKRKCVVIDERFESNNTDPELWYFRQDVMVNSHHWFWHLYHPIDATYHADRRGELFYSMHHNLLARYHAERLANNIHPAAVTPLILMKDTIVTEPEYSHLNDLNSQLNWVDRPPNQRIADTLIQSFITISVGVVLKWHQNLLHSIAVGHLLLPNGSFYPIQNSRGINKLGDTVEASVFSANPAEYGPLGYHNMVHLFIGFIEHPVDPQSVYTPGVMAGTSTAMRDSVFYRHHTHIDDIFHFNKLTLMSYQPTGGELPLAWPGVKVGTIEVNSLDSTNKLKTFWTHTKYDLKNGLDFGRNDSIPPGVIEACVKHLNHQPFEYKITIKNKHGPAKAAIRIFLAPRYNSNGERFSMTEQYLLFFVMDTFTVHLAHGTNNIIRKSLDSTLTITTDQALHELNGDQFRNETVYCGCGWPQHMLVPKGKKGCGMTFDLFVIVTNENGLPVSPPPLTSGPPLDSNVCEESYLYCGKFRKPYPDEKPMGYPFDRKPYRSVSTLDEYLEPLPNAASTQIKVIHSDASN